MNDQAQAHLVPKTAPDTFELEIPSNEEATFYRAPFAYLEKLLARERHTVNAIQVIHLRAQGTRMPPQKPEVKHYKDSTWV